MNFLLDRMENKNIVITLHRITDPQWFENVLLLLKKKYKIIDINDLYLYFTGQKKLSGCCHITIDDGDKSIYTIVYPLLLKYGIPVTIFVSPYSISQQKNFWFQEIAKWNTDVLLKVLSEKLEIPIGKISCYSPEAILRCLSLDKIEEIMKTCIGLMRTEPLPPQNLSPAELTELNNSGLVTIGAHTRKHPILANENHKTAENEITGSIDALSEMLGKKVEYFAYPNGLPALDFTPRDMDILKTANIKIAFSSERVKLSIKDDLLAVPRIGLSYGSTKFISYKLLLGKYWSILKSLRTEPEPAVRKKIYRMLGSKPFST